MAVSPDRLCIRACEFVRAVAGADFANTRFAVGLARPLARGLVEVTVQDEQTIGAVAVRGLARATLWLTPDARQVRYATVQVRPRSDAPTPDAIELAAALASRSLQADEGQTVVMVDYHCASSPDYPDASGPIWVLGAVSRVPAPQSPDEPLAVCHLDHDGPLAEPAVLRIPSAGGDDLRDPGRRLARALADAMPAPSRTADSWPSWCDLVSVLCLTDRDHTGGPPWDRRTGVLLAPLGGATVSFVHPGWERDVTSVETSAGMLVTSAGPGALRLTNMATGDRMEWGPMVPGQFLAPVPSPDGVFVAYTAYRRHGDQDIFTDKVDWNARCLARHRRIVRVDGPDERPVFSPDGEWVYYAHAEEDALREAHEEDNQTPPGPLPGPPPRGLGGGDVWSLCRVRAEAPHQNTEVEEVLAGFGRVGRMSFFPDGRRLLVWHEGGLDVVDVEARTKEPLGLPDLFDPDLLDGPPLKIQDPVVSPDGTRLAFSGYRDAEASDKLSGWYIYVCNLDGSGLERITPLEDDPVDFYVFPESGKSAFDLEKEMILEREREEAKGR